MRRVVESVEGEYRRYRKLAEGAFAQVADAELAWVAGAGSLSIASIAWHVSGNLASRFSDFLTADGEKPWRDRESEFDARTVSRAELLEKWESGWSVLFDALAGLDDSHLDSEVRIRGVGLSVVQALRRAALWLPANALAWAVAMPLVFALVGATLAESRSAGRLALLVLGIGGAGAVVGAVHGAFLVRLLAGRRHGSGPA